MAVIWYSFYMRYLGLDYGAKRVGVAISDEGFKLAFPKATILNDEHLMETLLGIISSEGVSSIVIGESKDFTGTENPINEEIKKFSEDLKSLSNLPISFSPEFLTSVESTRYDVGGKKDDARSAALILQRYLDKLNN